MGLGHIVKPFADGLYPFALGSREIQELERISNVGPLDLYRRLLNGGWRYTDVTETIRLGLVCAARMHLKGTLGAEPGGEEVELSATVANRLVEDYVRTYAAPTVEEGGPLGGGPLPWAESAILAAEILGAGVTGFATDHPTEPLGKKKSIDQDPDPTAVQSSRTDESGGPRSTGLSPTEE